MNELYLNNLTRILDIVRSKYLRNKSTRKIVFTSGCFDILHRGHIELFKAAKKTDTFLIVGVNSDRTIKKLKGHTRPYINQSDRVAILEAIKYIDYVQIFDTMSVLPLIELVKPDILIKGRDYTNKKDIVGSKFVESYGGKVVIYPLHKKCFHNRLF